MHVNNAARNKINNSKTITSKSLEYKPKWIGSTPNSYNILDAEVAVPWKYLSNFWRPLDFSFIYCEIELDLSWLKECVKSEIPIAPAVSCNSRTNPPAPVLAAMKTTEVTFQANNAKLFVPVVTLSINDNIKFLESIKQGFGKTILGTTIHLK